MSSGRGERLFRAWRESAVPYDDGAGRARFLEAFAARRAPSRRSLALGMAAAATMACAFAGAFLWWRTPAPLSFTTAEGEGKPGEWLATGGSSELPLDFSEGTRVVLAADSRARVEDLGRSGAVFVVERGEVRAHVVHRGDTNWRFRAGPFDVQVTGTVLDVQWDPQHERFAVRVDEGAVMVRGPSVGGTMVRAHERCVVDVAARTMHLSSIEEGAEPRGPTGDASASEAGPATLPVPSSTPSSSGAPAFAVAPVRLPPPTPWTTFERRGDYEAAYAAARDAGFESVLRSASADELLRLAQVSQLSQHADSGREALMACRRRFGGTGQASVAAYELGRASSGGEAARWFDTYVREQPRGPLAREASGRLIEACTAAGDSAGARDAATRYVARYPDGPHAALARRILSGSTY